MALGREPAFNSTLWGMVACHKPICGYQSGTMSDSAIYHSSRGRYQSTGKDHLPKQADDTSTHISETICILPVFDCQRRNLSARTPAQVSGFRDQGTAIKNSKIRT